MSENRSGHGAGLNWRGPLLAAAVFASVFGVLLLMAHLNQSNASDAGSSFRQDPYGTSLLFNSYERAGYKVKRSQDEDLLADQDAARTTAFFVGGNDYGYGDFETRDGKIIRGAKFHALLEDFLGRGGRVVLLQREPGVSVASISESSESEDKQKPRGLKWQKDKTWGLENEYGSAGKGKTGSVWAGPRFPAMPAGSEMMYLASGAPWLKADAQWTTLYTGPANAIDGSLVKPKSDVESPGHVYMAMRRVGNGELLVASQQSFLMNEAIKTHPNPVLLDFLSGGRPVIWLDETLHGLHQDEGVLWLVQRYRLQAALLLFWAALLVLLWGMSGDLVRRPARDRSAEIIRHGEAAGLAAQRLVQRSVGAGQVVAECWEQFRRRSPQDALAISTDAHWGSRLRAALTQHPLAGYKELRQLIAERHAFAKSLAHVASENLNSSPSSPKTTLQEERIHE